MSSSGREPPLKLLALDGGGIRGLSELLMIKAIMHRLMVEENPKRKLEGQAPFSNPPKPSDYFDLIGGTGTGGIIALMLGRLRMDMNTAIEYYNDLAEKVFSDPKPFGDGKFKATNLEEALKAAVKDVTGDSESHLLENDEAGICRTFVCAMNAHNMDLVLFRTYESRETHSGCKIWEAGRATSATPKLFKRIEIGRKQPFIDGGLGRNNPSQVILNEATVLFGARQIGCLVSIGSGQARVTGIKKPGLFQRIGLTDVVDSALKEIITDCEATHQAMMVHFADLPNTYFRLNVEQGMQGIVTSDWEKLSHVEAHTAQYLRRSEVDEKIALVANAIGVQRAQVSAGKMAPLSPRPTPEPIQRVTERKPGPSTENRFRGSRGMDRLKEAAVPGAFHNSLQRSDPPKCHPHTRKAILEKIMDWVTKKIDRDAFMMWLYGAAGAGKSAIAQTIAEMCHDRKFLLASFFFFRSDPLRSNSKRLIATIAYQVSVAIPDVRGLIAAVIDNDPHILSRSLKTQFAELIVNPLERLLEVYDGEHMALPNFIIIDGLDECMDGTQVQTLDTIFAVGKQTRFPFVFLVASRPEHGISTALGSGRILEGLTRLPLETDYESLSDIELFLHSKFKEIRHTHPIRSNLSSWPSSEDIQTLVDMSSGQFIYASTVVRFVSSHEHSPIQRLEMILGLRPTGNKLPFSELDALYRYVISSAEDVDTTVQIIAIALTLEVEDIEFLIPILGLEPDDIKLHLINLGSLVEYWEYPQEDPLERFASLIIQHATLGDFLFDEARSQEQYVDPRLIHNKIARAFLRDIKLKPADWDDYWKYIFMSLEHHCSKAYLNPELIADIRHLPVRKALLQSPYWHFLLAPCLVNFAKIIPSLDIEDSDLISTRYLSEHDEALISIIDSCPPFTIDSILTLQSSGARPVYHSDPRDLSQGSDAILALHGLIFHVSCDETQIKTLDSFIHAWFWASWPDNAWPNLVEFFLNPRRYRHHARGTRTHNSVTERCFSYIHNLRRAHFPGVHRWASKSKHRPWLWRLRKPKGVIIDSQFEWRRQYWMEYIQPYRKYRNYAASGKGFDDFGCDPEPNPFWALLLALNYLPCLLDNATKSAELITLAKMWSYRYPLSLFPHNAKKAGKAVERYLARFDSEK